MEMSPTELTELLNIMNRSNKEAKELGAREEREKPVPKNLFESFLKHAEKAKTLIDYENSKDSKWLQVKPERDSTKHCDYVEIGFSENGTKVDCICAVNDKERD